MGLRGGAGTGDFWPGSALLLERLQSWLLDTATHSSSVSSLRPVTDLAAAARFLCRPAHHRYFWNMGKEGILKSKTYIFVVVVVKTIVLNRHLTPVS